MIKAVFALIIGFVALLAQAQEANIFYFTPNIPQAVKLNPAKHNAQRKVVVGVAAINGFYGSLNSEASISDIFVNNSESNKTVFNIDKLSDAINGDGEIYQQFSVPLLFFGYNAGKNHYHFSISEREPLSLYFTDELLKILKFGNAPYAGQTTEVRLDMQLFHYGEYAFGYSRDFMENRLTVGATMKVLFGKSAINADNLKLSIYTQPDGEYIDLSGHGGLFFAGPFESSENTLRSISFNSDQSISSYFTNHKNPGFAIDLGATYQLNPKINVAASVTDLGAINWKKQVTGYNLTGQFTWQGVDVSDAFNREPDIEEELIALTDSLENAFDFNDENTVFKTHLTTRLYLGGSMQVNDILNIGVVNRVSFHPTHNITNMFMLTANANFNDVLSLTGSYAVTASSYDNFGIGIGVRAGFAQFILGTNNVHQLLTTEKAKYTSVRFGVNFLFGELNKEGSAMYY